MDCPPGSPCPLEGRVVRLEALARVTERWATGTAEPTMLRDAGRLVDLEARVALCETHQDLEQDWGARLQELERCCPNLPMRERPAPEYYGTCLECGGPLPAPAQGQPLCECGHPKWQHDHQKDYCLQCKACLVYRPAPASGQHRCANYDPRDKCRLCQGLQTDKSCYKPASGQPPLCKHVGDDDCPDCQGMDTNCDYYRPKQGQPRSCDTCRHEHLRNRLGPCRDCKDGSFWQPREGGGR